MLSLKQKKQREAYNDYATPDTTHDVPVIPSKSFFEKFKDKIEKIEKISKTQEE